MRRIIRATTDPKMSRRERENAAIARRICADGIVLLENDGSLPIESGKRVALYGLGARHTSFGGTGSGESRPRYQVSIYEGLVAAGITVSTQRWLDELDREYEEGRRAWKERIKARLSRVPAIERIEYASAHPHRPDPGRRITPADVEESDTDTAVYVLTRQAGEGSDRLTEEGDWYIRAREEEQLRFLSEHYEKVILILNTGGLMDLSFLDRVKVGAVLYALAGGMEMGNAVADILTGRLTPSGKLTDTWAFSYGDYPCAETFSYRSGDSRVEEYREGIFTGYRWFDAKGIAPRYAFGYGKSYTSFSLSPISASYEKGVLSAEISVKNTGERYSGREVVQLYLSCPDGKLKREVKSLVGFAKTEVLDPGCSQKLGISFALAEAAAYDEQKHRFILEKGDYLVSAGSSSDELLPVAGIRLADTIVTEVNQNVAALQAPFPMEEIPRKSPVEIPDGVAVFDVGPAYIGTRICTYEKPALRHNRALDRAMERISARDLPAFLCGTSYFGRRVNTVFGAVGRTTGAYFARGIPDLPMADGPQGLNLLPVGQEPLQDFLTLPVLPEALTLGKPGLFTGRAKGKGSYYQYCTSFPCETLVAQTWDRQLARREGDAVGREMEELGVAFWLAPALNIHRNPLCGRNYEYYSEDPFLSGELAAAATRGVQSHRGCFVTLKHFCCNNLENDRNRSDSRLDERTLRETYLKGFRIAVEKGRARGIMSSYNKVNGVYASNSYDLLTKVLRNEWGFNGLVMTDWFATGHHEALDELCAPAGCDLVMPATPLVAMKIRRACRHGRIGAEDLERAARNVINCAVHSCVRRRKK